MNAQQSEEPVGNAKITKGYCLPAEHVIHTVGPQLEQGKTPTETDTQELRNCYTSCLDSAEQLPALGDGRKVLAFCCISTGIFAFPQQLAAKVAVDTVREWIDHHPNTTITHIIFDVFLDADLDMYSKLLLPSKLAPVVNSPSPNLPLTSLHTAAAWLLQADTLIISAGAGLSASTGLDYTSTTLFSKHFHGYKKYGFRRLYDLFGPIDWPSEQVKWGYYFHHLLMIRNWPKTNVYGDVLTIAKTFEEGKIHIRTSNADGFLVKNGFLDDEMSTPQGRYQYLQCAKPCRKDAYFPSDPLLDAAIPFLDSTTQELTDPSKVPKCSYCRGELVLCVRSGDWFTEFPFQEGEQRWRRFRTNALRNENGLTVILELGVGMSTPGVLRWPNEDLTKRAKGRVKLVRIGIDAAGVVDWDLENAVGVNGDVGSVLKVLKGVRNDNQTSKEI
jgi:O-acetyl-ADP-ribose deacetylase (regulator of RNase III)/NAD-dependent SIR2 family protein deacetylase